MHRDLALLDLGLLVAGLTLAALVRSRWVGAALMAAGLLWLPLNNGVLEGAVLLAVGDRHGLTVADLAGVTGVGVGALRLWPPRGRPRRWIATRAAVVVALLLGAFVTAAFVTDVRVAEQRYLREPAPRPPGDRAVGDGGGASDLPPGQRSSLDIRRSASTLPPV